jgi:hypothetical protein
MNLRIFCVVQKIQRKYHSTTDAILIWLTIGVFIAPTDYIELLLNPFPFGNERTLRRYKLDEALLRDYHAIARSGHASYDVLLILDERRA